MIKNIERVIRTRKSIRTFNNMDFEPDTKTQIIDFMKSESTGLFGNKSDFYWIDGSSEKFRDVKLGTYGVISGTQNYITGKVQNSEMNFEDFGYCMEKLILYCAQSNIGTCWMGGTYKKTAFSKAVDLQEKELIPAVTPIGYFGSKKSTIDKMFRRVAGSDNRKPFDDLFYSQSFSGKLSENQKSTWGFFLEMVRLGPSASNKQPWRVVLSENVFHFYLKRTPNYNNKLIQSDLQRVDMGIAMAHFDLSLKEKKKEHSWFVENPNIKMPELTEYIASCRVIS